MNEKKQNASEISDQPRIFLSSNDFQVETEPKRRIAAVTPETIMNVLMIPQIKNFILSLTYIGDDATPNMPLSK
ncbi:MAG: hypothetical protein ACN6O6_20315 [Pseudomonas sp.]|uniref:hypothetical protein n=1 Tax=Pseudomonas sp. TaxID=306 RepID=UPI003D13E57D